MRAFGLLLLFSRSFFFGASVLVSCRSRNRGGSFSRHAGVDASGLETEECDERSEKEGNDWECHDLGMSGKELEELRPLALGGVVISIDPDARGGDLKEQHGGSTQQSKNGKGDHYRIGSSALFFIRLLHGGSLS